MSEKETEYVPKHPEYLTGDEPDKHTLYRLHPDEKEMEMYEKLGVEQFRLFYLATIGRLVSRVSGEKFISGTSAVALNKAIESTLDLETTHTIGFLFMLIGEIGMYANENYSGATAGVALNVLVNLYPIFMQRANRYKLLRVRDRKVAIRNRNID